MLFDRVVLDRAAAYATGCACDTGQATTETAARLANMRCELGGGVHFDYIRKSHAKNSYHGMKW